MALDLAFTAHGTQQDVAHRPLVVLHGLFGSATNWGAISRRLAAARPVFALDLRNHGASPWSADTGYAAMAADVAAFIHRHGLAPAAVMGHSMGGKAAMMLALSEPSLVERLIVVDVAPVAYKPTLGAYAEAMRAIDPRRLARRAEADPLLRASIPEEPIRLFLLQNLVAGPEGLRWRLNLDAIIAGMADIAGWPGLPEAAAYRGPALFLSGERSDYVRPRDHAAIRRRFPNAEIIAIPGAGHWVHAERPDALVEAVTRFLSEGVQTRS